MKELFATIAVELPVDGLFTYRVPRACGLGRAEGGLSCLSGEDGTAISSNLRMLA